MTNGNGNGNGSRAKAATLGSHLGLWAAALGIAAFLITSGDTKGREAQKVIGLDTMMLGIERDIAMHKAAAGHPATMIMMAVSDTKLEQIKTTTDQIQSDLKELIKELRNPPAPAPPPRPTRE